MEQLGAGPDHSVTEHSYYLKRKMQGSYEQKCLDNIMDKCLVAMRSLSLGQHNLTLSLRVLSHG